MHVIMQSIKISSKVDADTWEELKALARESHQNVSVLLTEAIGDYVSMRFASSAHPTVMAYRYKGRICRVRHAHPAHASTCLYVIFGAHSAPYRLQIVVRRMCSPDTLMPFLALMQLWNWSLR